MIFDNKNKKVYEKYFNEDKREIYKFKWEKI